MAYEGFLKSVDGVSPEVDELLAIHRLGPGLIEPDGHPDPGVALALSGGGFRATLSALGVLRFLADADLLGRVKVASSVSGGSMANGMFALRWRELRDEGFSGNAFDHYVLQPMLKRISGRSLQQTLYWNLWRTIGPKSFTDVLADKLDDWFYGGLSLDEIPGEDDCRFIFNASDIRTGRRYAFRQQDMGEWLDRFPNTGVRLAQAVAASCSVPGVFPPLRVPVPADRQRPELLDGGVYDTLGLDPVDHPDCGGLIVSVNAGGIYQSAGPSRFLPRVSAYLSSSQMSHLLNTSQRVRVMAERFHTWQQWRDGELDEPVAPSWARRGVQFSLETRMPEAPAKWYDGRPELPSWAQDEHLETWISDLAATETSVNRFPIDRCRSLIYRSWWLTGATLARWHAEVMPPERYPAWRPLEG
jgi:NTE family protein